MRIRTAVILCLLPAVAHAQSVIVGSGATEKTSAGGQVIVSSDGVTVQSGGKLSLIGSSASAQAMLQGAASGSPISVQSGGTIDLNFAKIENVTTLTAGSGAKIRRIYDTVFTDLDGLNPGATPWIDLSALLAGDRQNLPFSFNRVTFSDPQASPTRINVKAGANTPLLRLLGNATAHGNRWGESYDDDAADRVLFDTGSVQRANPAGTFDTVEEAIKDGGTVATSTLTVTLGPTVFIDDWIDWNWNANSSLTGPTVKNANLAPMAGYAVGDSDFDQQFNPRGVLVNCVVARGMVIETSADNCTFFDPAGTISVSYVTGRNVLVQNGYTGYGGNNFTTSLTTATAAFFADAAGYDFHLVFPGGGAAIDEGAALTVTTDFENDTRGADGKSGGSGTWDIGADEGIAPTPGIVNDGLAADIDFQTSITTISANWNGFSDPTGITGYEWAIGTTPGGTDTQPFTGVGLNTTATNSSLSLSSGTTYYVTVRATNPRGLQSTATSDGVTVDTTPPVAGTVNDGLGADIDKQTSTTTISANWSGFSDPESGITGYEWAIGVAGNPESVQPFTSVGLATNATNSSLSLTVGTTYIVTVRATNGASLQTTAASDGVRIVLPPMAGTYTVGSGKTYATPSAAAADLMDRGMTAAVIFDVYAGTYLDPLVLGTVEGFSPVNTITFRKAADASGTVNLGSIEISQVDYVTIQDFDSISASGANAVSLDDANNVTLVGNSISATGAHAVVILSAVNISLLQDTITVSGNGFAAVSVATQVANLTISRCRLVGTSGAGYGIYALNNMPTPPPGGWSITNNMIRGFATAGIYLWGMTMGCASGVAYDNSIFMDSSAPESYAVYYNNGTAATVSWRNNIFVNFSGTATSYGFYYASGALDSDYNDFYCPFGGSVGYYQGSSRFTLADWQIATGGDAHSISDDPAYWSTENLHIVRSSPCRAKGTGGLGVTVDYDGDPRDATAPDIGADEVLNDPDIPAVVNDGSGADIDEQITTTISANWSEFETFDTGPAEHYEWAIGTTPGGTDIQPFTNVGLATSASAPGLPLVPNTRYYATVKAFYGRAWLPTYQTSSDGVLYVTAPPASPPANFRAQTLYTYSIQWAWDAVPGAAYYEVHDASENLMELVSDTSVEEWNLWPNTQYSRHVHAANSLGSTAASSTVTVYTRLPDPESEDFSIDPCVSMPLITVVPPDNSTLGLTGVQIERSPDNLAWDIVRVFAATYEFHDGPLTDGTWYYRITFRNGDGLATAISPVRSVVTGQQPAAPTDLQASGGSGSIYLTWTAGTEDFLAGYNVYRGTATGGPYDKLNVDPVTVPSYTDSAITPGTRYYYVVKSVTVCSMESPPSNEASATGSAANAAPPPTNLRVIPYPGANHLRWDAVSGAVGYRVYRRNLVNPELWDLLNEPGKLVAGNEFRDSGLSNGQTYTYKVTAVK